MFENIKIFLVKIRLSFGQNLFGLGEFWRNINPHRRSSMIIVFVSLFLMPIVLYFAITLLGSQYLYTAVSTAHTSYASITPIKSGQVSIIPIDKQNISAYAVVNNDNLDIAVNNVNYTIKFYDTANTVLNTVSGNTFISPGASSYIIVSRLAIDTTKLGKAVLVLGEPRWQKSIGQEKSIEVKSPRPSISNTFNPIMLNAEGSIVNNSQYNLKEIRIKFLVKTKTNKVIATLERIEYDVVPYARRAYIVSWPNINTSEVDHIDVYAESNFFDQSNVYIDQKVNNLELIPQIGE